MSNLFEHTNPVLAPECNEEIACPDFPNISEKESRIGDKKVVICKASLEELRDLIVKDMIATVKEYLSDQEEHPCPD